MEYLQHLLMRSLWVVLVVILAVENGCNGCLEKERIALLQLKDSINFPNRIDWLPSWGEEDNMDCCQWERVECNSTTRRVIKLKLDRAREWGFDGDWGLDGYWHLNASILRPFESLQSLNLSRNQLLSFVGNEGIGILSNFSNLEELDLSYNYYLGNGILPSLNKLSNLKLLRLAQIGLDGSIYVEGIGILSNFSNLEELDLTCNYLDNSVLPSLNKLSNLKSLRLAAINLKGSIYVEEFNGLNNLKELDLSGNAISSIRALHGLGILSNLTNLEELNLSGNKLGNEVLPSLNRLSNLKFLRLSSNNLHESIYVKGLGILSNLTNLEELDLSGNNLGNGILWSLNRLSNLKFLSLSSNKLNGPIYVKGIGILSNLTNLEELDLSRNNLGNDILPSLKSLSNLKNLNLVGTELNGSIYVKEFDGLNNLKELDLGGNAIASISALNGSQEESGILKKLEILVLSYNEALNNSVWSFLGGLSSIKTLDLSFNKGLHGAVHNKDLKNLNNIENLFMDGVVLDDVLPYIRVMTSLQVLSLERCESKGILSIEGLCELKKLQELVITRSNFGDTLPWCLANLTSLRLLDITDNYFTGNIAQSPLINLTSLEYLAISNNDFEVPISFKSFYNHSKLVYIESLNTTLLEEEDFLATSPSFQLIGLYLSNFEDGHITRSFPRFLYHQHDLILVELSRTGFTGKFPYWLLDNNTRMETLILSYNSFVGPLLLPLRQMRNLFTLDISNNHLKGFLPYKIAGPFPSLEFFNMSTNNFEGNIPSSFGDMTALKVLDLSNNGLSGEIPVHLAKGCGHLIFLRLSNNFLKGPVLPHENNLTRLTFLYCDNNGFTEIPPNLFRSQLIYWDVSANQLVGKIPAFIGNMPLKVLYMADNHFEGPIPIEFCQLDILLVLDLSGNNINGTVPSCFNSSSFSKIRLSKNRLDGPFPMAFQYSANLGELDLSYNQFSGNIPNWIGSFSWLTVLLLKHNNFEGNIPKELCNLSSSLSLIDLSSNNLFGNIPPCISEIEFNGVNPGGRGYEFDIDSTQTFTLLLHDLGMVLAERYQEDQGRIFEIGTAGHEAKFTTKGMSLTYRGIVLRLFSGINLSHNRLTGPIPPEIGNLTNLKVLNLSHNNFIGIIPVTFSNLKGIECLDLSYNRLNGIIPSELIVLNFLAIFNLSYNNLSGRIPRVNQFNTFEPSSYLGNPLLCGEPLPKCNATDSPPSTTPRAAVNDIEDSGFMDMNVFYMSFAGSYVTVVLAIVVILMINPYWRRAWFYLVEVSITSCYYFVVDNLVGRRRCFLWK